LRAEIINYDYYADNWAVHPIYETSGGCNAYLFTEVIIGGGQYMHIEKLRWFFVGVYWQHTFGVLITYTLYTVRTISKLCNYVRGC